MQKLLTIVVPVYKVEPYINKCLDSCVLAEEKLMNQLEVIIVNDGTPDNSAEMSREYVKRYPQTFRQIDKENGGHGSAWNVGLKEATGKYLRFLDSDDWLTNLDRLLEKLQEANADLVFTNECVHYYDGDVEIGTENQKCSTLYDKLLLISENELTNILVDSACVNFRKCTYNSSLLKDLFPLFRERVAYDDDILLAAPFLYAKTMVAYDFVLYNLLRGRAEQSMNENVTRSKAEQLVQAYIDLHQFISTHHFGDNTNRMLQVAEFQTFIHCFGVVSDLPYQRRRILINSLLLNQPKKQDYSKLIKRYLQWPFIGAFLWDELRLIKQKILAIISNNHTKRYGMFI